MQQISGIPPVPPIFQGYVKAYSRKSLFFKKWMNNYFVINGGILKCYKKSKLVIPFGNVEKYSAALHGAIVSDVSIDIRTPVSYGRRNDIFNAPTQIRISWPPQSRELDIIFYVEDDSDGNGSLCWKSALSVHIQFANHFEASRLPFWYNSLLVMLTPHSKTPAELQHFEATVALKSVDISIDERDRYIRGTIGVQLGVIFILYGKGKQLCVAHMGVKQLPEFKIGKTNEEYELIIYSTQHSNSLRIRAANVDQAQSWLRTLRGHFVDSVFMVEEFSFDRFRQIERYWSFCNLAFESSLNFDGNNYKQENMDEFNAFASIQQPSMCIVILVVGTRGDVVPFIYLGQRLMKDGHRVRLATHVEHRTDVLGKGLEYYPLAGDPRKLSEHIVKTSGLIRKELLDKEARSEIPEITQMLRDICFSCYPACTAIDPEDPLARPFHADAIISNPVTYGHIHCAQALNAPLHIMFPQPWAPTYCFPQPLSNANYNSKWSINNYYSYAYYDSLQWAALQGMINQFRRSINLNGIYSNASPLLLNNSLKVPISHMWSPSFVPKCPDWPPHVDVVGELRNMDSEAGSNFTPPEALAKFLAEGEKPLYVGFGSMVIPDPSKLVAAILEASDKLHCRVLLQSGWTKFGENCSMLSERVMVIGPMPHDFLLPRELYTMGARAQLPQVLVYPVFQIYNDFLIRSRIGLRAGNPTFICPFFGDQHFWAEMVYRAGVGPKGCKVKKLTGERLCAAFQVMQAPETIARARELGKLMTAEDGVKRSVDSFYARTLQLSNHICEVSILRNNTPTAKLARVYCLDCNIKLCKEIDEEMHREDGDKSTHRRVPYRPTFWPTIAKPHHSYLPASPAAHKRSNPLAAAKPTNSTKSSGMAICTRIVQQELLAKAKSRLNPEQRQHNITVSISNNILNDKVQSKLLPLLDNQKVLEFYVQHGADPNVPITIDSEFLSLRGSYVDPILICTALHLAIIRGNLVAADTILGSPLVDISCCDSCGRPAVALLDSASNAYSMKRYDPTQRQKELGLLPKLLDPVVTRLRDVEGCTPIMAIVLRDRQWNIKTQSTSRPSVVSTAFAGSSSTSPTQIHPAITTTHLVLRYLRQLESHSDYDKSQRETFRYADGGSILLFDLIQDQWLELETTADVDSVDHRNRTDVLSTLSILACKLRMKAANLYDINQYSYNVYSIFSSTNRELTSENSINQSVYSNYDETIGTLESPNDSIPGQLENRLKNSTRKPVSAQNAAKGTIDLTIPSRDSNKSLPEWFQGADVDLLPQWGEHHEQYGTEVSNHILGSLSTMERAANTAAKVPDDCTSISSNKLGISDSKIDFVREGATGISPVVLNMHSHNLPRGQKTLASDAVFQNCHVDEIAVNIIDKPLQVENSSAIDSIGIGSNTIIQDYEASEPSPASNRYFEDSDNIEASKNQIQGNDKTIISSNNDSMISRIPVRRGSINKKNAIQKLALFDRQSCAQTKSDTNLTFRNRLSFLPDYEGTLLISESDWQLRSLWNPRYMILYGSFLFECPDAGSTPIAMYDLSKNTDTLLHIETLAELKFNLNFPACKSLDDEMYPELPVLRLKSQSLELRGGMYMFQSVWTGVLRNRQAKKEACEANLIRWLGALSAASSN